MTTGQKIYLPFKRFIDIFGSFVGIIVCFALVWWWVLPINFFVTKGHPIFLQVRSGRNDKSFKIIKIRTMRMDADPDKTSLYMRDKNLYTGFGNFMRKFSIDETLQLFNIFVGHMAFIGPRPLIDVDEDHITIEIRKKNGAITIRPGMSGYAQVHDRDWLAPDKKGEMDGYYFKHFSLWFDIKIFVYSLFKSVHFVRGRKITKEYDKGE